MRREDLRDVEVLRRVDEGAPEEDEEEDQEYRGGEARFVSGIEVECLCDAFEDERHGEAAEPDEQEETASDAVDKEGCEYVAGEGECDPERRQEEGHKVGHAERSVQEDPVVGDDVTENKKACPLFFGFAG